MSTTKPKFPLGQIVYTPGAIDAFVEAQQSSTEFLMRHVRGDWGELSEDDKLANDMAVEDGSRIFSAYTLSTGEKIWLITESDRSVTTFLLPEDY